MDYYFNHLQENLCFKRDPIAEEWVLDACNFIVKMDGPREYDHSNKLAYEERGIFRGLTHAVIYGFYDLDIYFCGHETQEVPEFLWMRDESGQFITDTYGSNCVQIGDCYLFPDNCSPWRLEVTRVFKPTENLEAVKT